MAEDNRVLTSEIRTGVNLLVRQARQDPQAFGALYQLYVRPVFKYLYSRLGNVHEAEDVTAQTFLGAFESFQNLHQDEHFPAWLFTIARHKALDHYRRRKNVTSLDDVSELPGGGDPLQAVVQSEQAGQLAGLLQALPESERELLRLRFLAELSFPEMARLLHRNEAAVKKALYRLLARLQSQLEEDYE